MPSADEVNQLRATGELYRDGVFKLQIEAMLPALRPRYDSTGTLDVALHRLKAHLDQLPTLPGVPFDSAQASLHNAFPGVHVRIPWPGAAPRGKHAYAFAPPTAVHLVGSWPLRTAAIRSAPINVDMDVQMPSWLFSVKDVRAGRYAAKRAFYCAALAASIASAPHLGLRVRFEAAAGATATAATADARVDAHTTLVLLPRKDQKETDFSKQKVVVRIHLSHALGLFPLRRLGPARADKVSVDEAHEGAASHAHDSSILRDSLRVAHLFYLHATASSCPAFADACLLLKTWAFKRGLGGGDRACAVGSASARFLLTMILAHLLHDGAGAGFSSYQLFRAVLDFLARRLSKVAFMKHIAGIPNHTADISRQQWFAPCLVDPTGALNLLAGIPQGTLSHMAASASASIALLDVAGGDAFAELFIDDRSSPLLTFDEVASVGASVATTDALASLALRALGSRAKYVACFDGGASTWSIDSPRPCNDNVDLALVLDAEHALRLVEHGPAPEDAAGAQSFKQFWGDLSELRRFRDGRIVEAVVWPAEGRGRIPRKMVEHILARHAGARAQAVQWHADAYEGLLQLPAIIEACASLQDTSKTGFQAVQSAFEQLCRALRALQGLPLALIAIAPAAEALRCTSVFIPPPLVLDNLGTRIPDAASHLPAHDLILTLESSGKWPDELSAIRAMKLAFYQKMAEMLPLALEGSRAVVVRSDADADDDGDDDDHLEITLSQGFAFRARIHHERERTLLARAGARAGAALARHSRRFDVSARHHALVSTLQNRFIAFSETCRLLKRWTSCQMLSHIAPELLELVVLRVFLAASRAPCSASAGFLRSLQMLALWNWKEEALLVAGHAAVEQSEEDVRAGKLAKFDVDAALRAQDDLKTLRAQDPSCETRAWIIVTEMDLKGADFASRGPTAAEAHAMQRLAGAACAIILERGAGMSAMEVRSIFTPSLSHYDFLIHLDPTVLPRYAQSLAFDPSAIASAQQHARTKFANLASPFAASRFGILPRPAFDVGSDFVNLLMSLFSDTLRLFYDAHGGSVIGGLWNPSLLAERPFKPLLGYSSVPCGGDGKDKMVRLNCEAVCEEIERLGKGIVVGVQRVSRRGAGVGAGAGV
ncbi:Nucleolar RNA-associated protein (NRAP) [Ceraceosorus bombacis]|uniref:U3 small nucleolar RNA-associated protein 22 n=1 Tax=Ceraceosorus bombacis TaxID=401625 RepID=A0A0P1B9C5_9BASI|nr:Nucleolar RNA-associated protein (NRAP) [Ceraceosorus bombacis]